MNPPTAENTSTTIITDAMILDLELKMDASMVVNLVAPVRKYILVAPRNNGLCYSYYRFKQKASVINAGAVESLNYVNW